ncbi:cell wall protein DAN4-like [Melanaphis sacchari]|uniref:cell wall protein DAN4-like n=1 Tax=Melanaphis sacchari TaxID=742174 RepID=UPI000DC14A7D|nr:cell wall protein DAN4-like [Melanaphis sacchari]
MKNVVWIFLIYTLVFNLFTITYCIKNKGELNVNLKLSNSSTHGTSDNHELDAEQINNDNDDFELEDNIDEAPSEIVESQVPFPTNKPSEIESEVLVRKPRRKRRRRRKRPRTSTHNYEENINHPIGWNQEPPELDYADGYIRRRPMKRRRRPLQRRPLIEGGGIAEEENILPRRKLIRRPADSGNKMTSEDVKRWEPTTSTEEVKWKITTSETTNTISTVTPKSTTITTTTTNTPKTSTISPTLSTYKLTDDNSNINHRDVGILKKSNSSRADIIVLHKRPINSNLPPTSAVIRRRLKPQNTTMEEVTVIKPKITVVKEDLPLSLLPPDFKMTENAPPNESKNNTDDYQFNDEALTKMMKEQPNNNNDEFKFKSDSIPKVKDEILSLLKTKTGSSLLSNILNLRNMSLEELLQHRERGSSQRHQEFIDAKEESIDISADEPIVTENAKNFTNYLIETKLLAQKNKVTLQTGELNDLKQTKDKNKELTTQISTISTNLDEKNDNQYKYTTKEPTTKFALEKQTDDIKSPIQIGEKTLDHEVNNFSKPPINIEHLNNLKMEQEAETGKIQLNTIFDEKKVFSFPTTTTYTTTDVKYQDNEATSFASKTPKTRIVLETSEREPRLFDSLPDFSIKTTQRPLITPTIPSQVLFIQDTNHLDKYQSYSEKNKDIDEENNLVYRRFEMRKLPVAVKSAIIASAAILAVAILGFFVLLISCRIRQKKRIIRKKSVFCQHNLHHDPDLRSSARSTSPVMDKHCHDQYYDGYGGRIDAHTTANRQYYLWRTLRKTFRYD